MLIQWPISILFFIINCKKNVIAYFACTSTYSTIINLFNTIMMEMPNTITVPPPTVGRIQLFLWWLATAEPELQIKGTAESNRFTIVGTTVFCTWCFATLAWCYFFSTVTEQWWVAALLGFFMGFVILSIDRALIKNVSFVGSKKWWPLLLRLALAAVIGLFMAQPALHFLFKKEIALHISADNLQKRQQQQTKVTSIYQQKTNDLLLRKKELEQENANRYAELQTARNNYLAETDGSGGTGKVGVKAVALAKLTEYQKLDSAYQKLLLNQQPEIESINKQLLVTAQQKTQMLEEYSRFFNNGFLTQAEALQHLLAQHPPLLYRYILLVLLLLLIELMPLITKMMMPAGAYEQRVQAEQQLAMQHIQQNLKLQEQLLLQQAEQQAAINKKLQGAFFEAYEEKGKSTINSLLKPSNVKGKELLKIVNQDVLI
jgi:hypothetical protein